MVAPAPDMSVVVATRDRWDELCRSLRRLELLPERPRLVVVDNGSADGTPQRARRCFPAATVVSLPSNLGAAARTVGARVAGTPLVAFSDDDSWWQPGALAAAARLLAADPAVGLVAGRVLVGAAGRLDPVSSQMERGRLDEWLRPSPQGRRGVTGFLACAAVVRRSAFLAAGGFEPHLLIGGEEELLALDLADAGWKLVYEPGCIALHHPSVIRDGATRRRLTRGNRLLCAWLRLSPRSALASSAKAALGATAGRDDALGLVCAARSAGWALSRRRRVGAATEAAFYDT